MIVSSSSWGSMYSDAKLPLCWAACCVGKLKFSLHGGSSFSSVVKTWSNLTSAERKELERQRKGQHQQGQQLAQQPSAADTAPIQVQGQDQQHPDRGQSMDAPQNTGASASGGAGAGACEGEGEVDDLMVTHPRSQRLLEVLPDPERNFKLMAQVGGVWARAEQHIPWHVLWLWQCLELHSESPQT